MAASLARLPASRVFSDTTKVGFNALAPVVTQNA